MPVPSPHSSKISGFFNNATNFLTNANGTLSAGGNTLQNLSGITNTIANFSKPAPKTSNDNEKPKNNWLLIAAVGLGVYLLMGRKKGK